MHGIPNKDAPSLHGKDFTHFQAKKLLFMFMTIEYLMLDFRSVPAGYKSRQL